MSLDEIRSLEAQIAELESKKLELAAAKQKLELAERDRKAAEEHEALLKTHVVVTVSYIHNQDRLIINSNYRPDIVDVLRTVEGRVYRGEKENSIPFTSWDDAVAKILALPFTEIQWADGVEETFNWLRTAPNIEVTYDDRRREFKAEFGPKNHNTYNLQAIPGSRYEWMPQPVSHYVYFIPFSEGWRIAECLEAAQGVVYSAEASAIILEQAAKRLRLDAIAISEDSDFARDLELFKLRAHQRVAVEFDDAADGNMILADDTGIGKTRTSLACSEMERRKNPQYKTLIVVKAANLANWRREMLDKLGLPAPYICFTGTPNEYDAAQICFGETPYVMISYDTMGAYVVKRHDPNTDTWFEIPKSERKDEDRIVFPWVELFKIAEFNRRIFDEAQSVKNPGAYRTKAVFAMDRTPHTMVMSATPIMNKTEELGPLIRIVQPNLFKSHEEFKRNYTIDGRAPSNVEALHKMLRPFFLRRKKSDVMKDLPPINRIQYFFELSPKAQRIYKKAESWIYEELADFNPYGIGGDERAIFHYLAKLTRLKQICAADAVDTTVDIAQNIIEGATNGESHKKVLIFSAYKGTAYSIATKLGADAVCTVTRSNGKFYSMNAIERDTLFESVRNRPEIRYVVTTEAAREGHNIEYCWWTIFNDLFWGPLAHYQAEGRAYGRLSDSHPIDAYYVTADTDIIRWIMELLDEKLSYHEGAIDGVELTRDFTGSIGAELLKKIREHMWSK